MKALEPMLCLLAQALPEGDEWAYEIKWDGYRAIGRKDSKDCSLTSRNHKPLHFLELAQALGTLKCKSCVVDGEVIALDAEGRPSFSTLQNHRSHMPELRLVLFDLLEHNGKSLLRQPWEQRREALAKLIPANGPILLSQELQAAPSDLMEQAASAGFEGIVAKRRDSTYEPGERNGSWVKWKAEREEVFCVGGFMRGTEIVIGQRDRRGLRYVARVKAGFVARTRQRLLAKLRPLAVEACPFYNLPEKQSPRFGDPMDREKMAEATWVEPLVQIRVKFVEWTSSKHLRHSRFAGFA